MKEEIQTYQAKCETTEGELNKKNKIIEDLQNTIQQLNKKVYLLTSTLPFTCLLDAFPCNYLSYCRTLYIKVVMMVKVITVLFQTF
jgi:hypothetical protein